jgi:hypothetical protein
MPLLILKCQVRFTERGVIYSVFNYENNLSNETRIVGLDIRNCKYLLNHIFIQNLRICDFDIDEQNGKIFLSTEMYKPNLEHPEGELHDIVYEFDINSLLMTLEHTILWDINDGKEGRLESILYVPELGKLYVCSRYYEGGIKAVVVIKKNGKLYEKEQIKTVDAPVAICRNKRRNELYILGYYHSDESSLNLGVYVVDINTDKIVRIINLDSITNDSNIYSRTSNYDQENLIGIDYTELNSNTEQDEKTILDNNIMSIDELNERLFLIWRSRLIWIDLKSDAINFFNSNSPIESIQYDCSSNSLFYISSEKTNHQELFLNRWTRDKLEFFQLPSYIKEIRYFVLHSQLNSIALNIVIESEFAYRDLNTMIFYPLKALQILGRSKSVSQII